MASAQLSIFKGKQAVKLKFRNIIFLLPSVEVRRLICKIDTVGYMQYSTAYHILCQILYHILCNIAGQVLRLKLNSHYFLASDTFLQEI